MILRLVCVLLLGAAGAVEVSRTMRNSPRATGNDLMSVLGEIPQCAVSCFWWISVTDGTLTTLQLTCLTSKADLIGCSLLDIECQCASKNSTAILQPCLVSSCTYEETFSEFVYIWSPRIRVNTTLELLHIQAGLCNKPHNNRSLAVKLTGWTTGTITIIAVVLRFAARYLGGSNFWWDDWLQLMSMLLVIPMTVALLLSKKHPSKDINGTKCMDRRRRRTRSSYLRSDLQPSQKHRQVEYVDFALPPFSLLTVSQRM